MTFGYYCAIFPFCGGEKKDKKTKAFYDWATTGIPVKTQEKIGKNTQKIGENRIYIHLK